MDRSQPLLVAHPPPAWPTTSSPRSRWTGRPAAPRRSARPRTAPDTRRCRRSLLALAVELRPEVSRGRLQDFIGPAQLLVLPLQLDHPGPLRTDQTRSISRLDLLLDDPPPQRLPVD